MKHSTSLIGLVVCIFQFLFVSCELFSIQDTDEDQLTGLNELKETILPKGQTVAKDTLAPFIYREWFGWTSSQQPIDSIYLLKNRDGELLEKYAIVKLINYDKKHNRSKYLLSNGKYFYVEVDQDLHFYVSEFVGSASGLDKDLQRGKYVNIGGKPDNW